MFLTTALFWEIGGVLMAAAAACSVLGSFLVLRRLALLSDAIGHVLLLGIVIAFLITQDLKSPLLMIGAAGVGLAAAILVEWTTRSRLVREDAAIGLVFPAMFALGVILTSMYSRNIHLDVDRVLLGSPEMAPHHRAWLGAYDLGPRSLLYTGAIFSLNALLVTLFFKELKLATFDPILAGALGFAPAVLHYGLLSLVSLTAVAAFDAVGPVLVVAFFVVPSAAAYLLTDRLAWMVAGSVLLGVGSAWAGTVLAFIWDTTLAGTVAVTMGAVLVVVLLLSPRHGLAAATVRRWRQRREFFDRMLVIHLLHHEGTPLQNAECRLATLPEHMAWSGRVARAVAARVVARGWAAERDGVLHLTPTGRAAAEKSRGLEGQRPTPPVS